jgi:glycosyltransferase involved in cell wall biosynthesis
MIVKNEEKYLAGCLDSVKDIAGEIIIVDTGSTDSTISIAEKYNAKVYNFPWIGDFSAARNYSLDKAAGDWILYLDADERLSPESVDEVKKIISSPVRGAYRCRVVSVSSADNHHSVMSYSRLFLNAFEIRFRGKVHEQIEDSVKENNYPVINSSVEIIHLGYNVGEDELHIKAERNLQILLDEYRQNGTSYYAFQLGQTLGILNRKQEAEHYFTEALKDISLSGEYRGIAFRYLAINNAERKNYNLALEFIEQSIKEDDKQPLNLMAAAKLYQHFKMNDKAADCAVKSYNANKTFFAKGTNSAQNIMMDENELCIHGLEIAVKTLNKNLFSFFFQKIKNDSGKEWEVFNSIYCNNKINEKEAAAFAQSLNIQYLQPLLMLLENYSYNDTKELLLNKLARRFSNNADIHMQLAKYYLTIEKYEAAENEFEIIININPGEPSYYFYLISACIQGLHFEKLQSTLQLLDNRFGSDQNIKPKIDMLKQKLISYVK